MNCIIHRNDYEILNHSGQDVEGLVKGLHLFASSSTMEKINNNAFIESDYVEGLSKASIPSLLHFILTTPNRQLQPKCI